MARELLKKEDGFITVEFANKEYMIETIKRVPSHANIDDTVMNWILKIRDGGEGNLKK